MTRERIKRRPFYRARVWGTGSFGDIARGYHHLKYLSVRGPRTRDALQLSKQIPLGDPALLLAELVDRPAKAHRWGIIPHVAHRQDPAILELGKQPGTHIIDLGMADPLQAAREIAACDFVISSSLHGLITADAFGVPSVWTSPGNSLYGGVWKFYDYFESVGRLETPVSPTVCLQSLETNASAASAQIVASLCKGLRRSFPYK
nr:polysaccharide pyruvyl transferase family protein [Mesorhizobium soli]